MHARECEKVQRACQCEKSVSIVDWHRHQHAFGVDIEDFLVVASPARLGAATARDLPFSLPTRKRRYIDFPNRQIRSKHTPPIFRRVKSFHWFDCLSPSKRKSRFRRRLAEEIR